MGFTICSLTSTRLLYHIHIRVTRYHVTIKKYPPTVFLSGERCWHYLFFQAVASQVLSAETSLTTVFGMGTGGPSP